MIASVAAAVADGNGVSTGDGLGRVLAVGLGDGSSVGSTDGDGLDPAPFVGDVDADGTTDGEALAAGVVGSAEALALGSGLACGDGVGEGLGSTRAIGMTKILPPVVDALDSTTAAWTALGARTTEPGCESNDTSCLALRSSGAQSDAGAASDGQTAATLAIFIVYLPSAA
jgi:hypothetical protein